MGTGAGLAAFNVHGDQMTPNTQELIRTRAGANSNGFWRMFRAGTELGRFYQTNPFNAFRVQAVQPNGAQPGMLFLENAETDGIMLRANGAQLNVNTYPLRLDGFGSIGIKNGGTLQMPSRSRWQMVDVNGFAAGAWRPYYRNGVLFTGNNDLAYVGHRYFDEGNGTTPWNYTLQRSDLLISAGDSSFADAFRSRIRFTYTSPPAAGAATGASSYNGLEFMQLWAETNTEGYLGLGDFTAGNLTPTQRFDMLNGFMRHRQLPTDAPMTTVDKAMVVDNTGIVGWRPWPTAGLSDCDWETPNSTLKLLHTARLSPTANPTCPEEDWRVSIGTLANVQSKLKVYGRTSVGGHAGAIQAELQPSASAGGTGVSATVSHETAGSAIAGDAIGVDGYALGSGFRGYGVRGTATALGSNTTEVNGASGFATLLSGSSTGRTFGLRSEVDVNTGASGSEVYGSFSKVFGTGSVTGNMTGVLGWCNPLGGTILSLYGGDLSADWGANANVTYSTGLLVKSTTLGTNYADNSIGVDASAYGGDVRTLGVQSVAQGVGSSETTGVKGTAQGQVPLATGVFGKAQNVIDGSSVTRIGVRGSLFPVTSSDLLSAHASILGDFAGNGTEQWAGFFDGKVGASGTITAGVVSVFSDESIKTDVQPMEDQSGNLMALQPRTFQYTDEARQRLNLPEGVQPGFMAPEVQEVFPELVSQVTMMARRDSVGNEIAPSLPIHAVNYTGLVPVLVSGHQQQENRLASLEGQVAQLQSQLAQAMEQMTACCAGVGIGAGQRALTSASTSPALENDLRVVPNPVADRTELRYTVANEGRVRLEITDASSRVVLTREEGQRSAGSFMYEWDTTLLAPGTYICTLYINDEFLVKKSVKLGTR